jgi:hypothetical protein
MIAIFVRTCSSLVLIDLCPISVIRAFLVARVVIAEPTVHAIKVADAFRLPALESQESVSSQLTE